MLFHLQKHITELASPTKPSYTNQKTFLTWQHQMRQTVKEYLGMAGHPTYKRVEQLCTLERAGYRQEKYALDIGELEIPFYLLIPASPPPFKTILLFNGHHPSLEYVLGNFPNELDEAEIAHWKSLNINYAERLAQAGYLVCVVEQRGLGERLTDQINGSLPSNSCRHLAFEYLMRGETLLGKRCWDAMGVIDYLLHREDVIPESIGCTGYSGGGTTALWLAALDERIQVTVAVACFSSFGASILSMPHCECNYIPNILQLGDMGDFVALIAPRPLRIIAGQQDPIFPIEAAYQQYEVVERAYQLLGANQNCSFSVHSGEHRYHYSTAFDWFQHRL